MKKRIAAIVLSNLACELARLDDANLVPPFACIVDDDTSALQVPLVSGRDRLDAVDPIAWRYGARPGQRASEANAFAGQLRVVHLTRERIVHALETIAEIALGFGTTAALTLEHHVEKTGERALPVLPNDGALRSMPRYPAGFGAGPLDTVWLDITGCARLVGGEDLLAAELTERAMTLGHRSRVAIASGPRIAQAIARWTTGIEQRLASPNDRLAALELGKLPIAALPIERGLLSWFGKLGIFRIDDLTHLDRAQLAHRLGPYAGDVLELVSGRDPMPLCPYHPPRTIVESAAFEEEITGIEPLTFVLRGLIAKAIARLDARGEACTSASLALSFDRGVIALANRDGPFLSDGMRLDVELPLALSRQDDLLRTFRAKLEHIDRRPPLGGGQGHPSPWAAPLVAVTLTLDGLTTKPRHQLEALGGQRTDPRAFPLLLAELSAWLGTDRVGVLRVVDSHRPEMRSKLVPVASPVPVSVPSPGPVGNIAEPTRILPEPLEVGTLEKGALIRAEHQLYLVDQIQLTARIDRVEWWTASPVCRDYARAWLRSASQYGEACVYVDRTTKRGFLHGWYD